MVIIRIVCLAVCCWVPWVLWAGDPEEPSVENKYQLQIKKASTGIVVDGKLDEQTWQEAAVADRFFQNFPFDTSFAITRTEVKMSYDDRFLYIAAVCYDNQPGDYVIQSLRRDFPYHLSDAFAVYIDPYNDQTNGFTFVVNPYGVQREGLLVNGGGFGARVEWDNRWFAETQRYADRWEAEMAIPFKTLRYKEGQPQWRVNFARNDLKRNEQSSWAPVPRNFNVSALVYAGSLQWDEPLGKPGPNISFIPYVNASGSKDFEENTPQERAFDAGFDAKVSVTPALNLDLTVNPDFSQVDVDVQQINLTRFNLFFPERRQFFLENSDLFSQFGFRQIRPFFSRRIGLNDGAQVPILAGARLSGKVNRQWRIGFMNIQADRLSEQNLLQQNYTVAAFQRQVFKTSNIAGIFVNRQAFSGGEVAGNDFNRVAGLDFNLQSPDSRWRGKLFYHQAFTSEKMEDQYAHASWLMYNDRRVFWMWNHEYVGKNYIADVGFVPRINQYNPETGEIERFSYWRLEPEFTYTLFPFPEVINNVGVGVYSSIYLDSAFGENEYVIRPYVNINFQNSARIGFGYNENFIRLYFPFFLTSDDVPLAVGDYRYRNVNFNFQSNVRKPFNVDGRADYGTFFNGYKLTYSASLNYRHQPWGIYSISFQRNEIDLPSPLKDASFTLIGPRLEFSFTRSIFVTSVLQYNTQAENINLYGRLQWRFKPMSDFFVVYTDNYTTQFGAKNRALIMKLVYWLSI